MGNEQCPIDPKLIAARADRPCGKARFDLISLAMPVQPTRHKPFKAAAGISQTVPAPRQPAAHRGGASWLRALSGWKSSV